MKRISKGDCFEDQELISELLILSDGRVLAHNLTVQIAEILKLLDPHDDIIERRASAHPETSSPADNELSN